MNSSCNIDPNSTALLYCSMLQRTSVFVGRFISQDRKELWVGKFVIADVAFGAVVACESTREGMQHS